MAGFRARRTPVAVTIAAALVFAGLVAQTPQLGFGTASARGAVPMAAHFGGLAPRTVFGTNWPVYHHDGLGTGVDPTGTNLSPAAPAWTSPVLDGKLYGEPLVAAGRVIVATENDTVYALAANTGGVLWATHVGTAVASSSLGCGNISPVAGITGTPVIDPARGEIFAVTDEQSGGGAAHFLAGVDLYSGAVLLHQSIDLPGSNQLDQLQRTGLALDNGRVVIGFGGNFGDCGTYHGWVVSIPEGGGSQHQFEVAAADNKGAVWMGGAAPIVDAQGNVWVATGNSTNTSSSDTYDLSDSVVELSPSMSVLQSFAPAQWYNDNGADADLGSASPAVLGNGLVLQVGKSNTAYLLSQQNLGGVGGQQAAFSFCAGNDVDGGDAITGSTVYVPCQGGVIKADTATNNLSIQWQTSTGSGGPPIVAGGLVWTISQGAHTLYGLDPSTGNPVQQFSLVSVANHFPTPSVADGLLLAAASNQVHAFTGPDGLPPPPTPAPPRAGYWTVASDGGVFAFGGAAFHGSMGGQRLVAPVVGMAATADGGGYWLVASDGGIFAFGDAGFFGSMGGRALVRPMVGMAAAPNGSGYWTVASDGGVFAFGGAGFFGSMGGRPLNRPVVGMAATADGGGCWLVASDGGIFAFGDAAFSGSMGGQRLNQPVVAMAAASGGGYWLVASDGGVFAFGGAGFFGSMGSTPLVRPVVGMTPTSRGAGYWLVASDGGVFAFGDAPFAGSVAGLPLAAPMVALGAPPPP
jgi:outer membrane protein assembly factor BamB